MWGKRWFPWRKRQFPLKGTVVSIKRNGRSLTGKRQFPLQEMIGNYKLLRSSYIEFCWQCYRAHVHARTVLS